MRFNIKDLIPEEYHKLMLGDAFDRYDAELELDRKMYGDEDRLYEGLITTHPIEKAVDVLDRRGFNVADGQGMMFYIRIDPDTDLDDLYKITNNLGYFPASVGAFKNKMAKFDENELSSMLKSYNMAFVRFEAKYDYPIDIKGIKYLYHATKKLYLKNIQKNGLVSKSKSKIANHPERIYLAYTQEGAEKFAKHPTNLTKSPVLKRGKPETLPISAKKLYSIVVILRISTTRLPHTLKAYVDPNYKDEGCYTLNTIPWSAIDIAKEIEQ